MVLVRYLLVGYLDPWGSCRSEERVDIRPWAGGPPVATQKPSCACQYA